jgi:5-methylcytosine-specific restriction endonuclease McrA
VRGTPHLCSEPYCSSIVDDGPGRCPEHRRTADSFRSVDGAAYGTTRWRRLSAYVRERDPTCRVCRAAPTAEAHHLDHAKPGDAAFWNPARIVGVCTPSHRKLTGRRSVEVQRGRSS